MLRPVPYVEAPDPIGPTIPRSGEDIVSLDLIRSHTKTDDVMSVTDEQLRLYLAAAIEAAEQYTGLLLSERRRVVETVQLPDLPGSVWATTYRNRPKPVKHRMQFPCADGKVWLYGGRDADSRLYRVQPGAKEVVFQPGELPSNDAACCGPVGAGLIRHDVKIMYLAGFDTPNHIPAGIKNGILKFIAWSVENPGDVMRSVEGTITRSETVLRGSNNVALASGAMEQWRQYGRI